MSNGIIDLRSDTVTRPSAAMRQAMAQAEVGDDVFGEDPTVIRLEQRLADLFGKEAAVYCPSGTMANQIAVNIHTRPGDEVICDEGAHIYRYEGGGTMATSGCSVKLLESDRGRFTAKQVEDAINAREAQWLANTRLVNIENTCNRGGGAIWDLEEIHRIQGVCIEHGLAFHMDGARIFNAVIASGRDPKTWGDPFDTVSICLSKGLGAPVGSVLVGSTALIAQARRVRKRLGGGMRQAGIMAAACLYALDHQVERLKDDHKRARKLGDTIHELPDVTDLMPVETNILIFSLAPHITAATFCRKLKDHGVLAMAIGPHQVRMVLHLDVNDEMTDRVIELIKDILP